ncbi:hypothetical protein CVT26_003903 [Gymnopilus dilepis]|uniref:Uncharacterized protein n=1 Tax=Gymnopilus dilepis TaxID=231916 RepID=A0A409YUS4_9AGAR|nr:hypothetical protein CVT26_003903 [Gymnopilus dilepis]
MSNQQLRARNIPMQVLSIERAYDGWSMRCSAVPLQQALDIIRAVVFARVPNAEALQPWVGLPGSTSYLRIRDVPYYKLGTTRRPGLLVFARVPNAEALQPWVGLPGSTSYLRIRDVPYYKRTPRSRDDKEARTSPSEVVDAMLASAIIKEHLFLKGVLRITHNSQSSTTATAYFNIWDSQSASRAKELIGKPFMFRTHKLVMEAVRANPGTPLCTCCWRWGHPAIACRAGKPFMFRTHKLVIEAARANPGTPLCTRCWRWGHPAIACRAAQPKCARCAGPHTEDQHRHHAGCCKGEASADPPVAPTPAGQPCPHTKCCPNCGRNHSAYERACKFWSHRFDREWFVAKYAEVRANRMARLRRPPNHPHVD